MNGGFAIWQRGISNSPSNGAYFADGWVVSWGGAAPASLSQGINSGGAPFPSRFFMIITGAAGNTLTQILQRIEAGIAAQLVPVGSGGEVTFSAFVTSDTGVTPQLQVTYPTTANVILPPTNLQPVPPIQPGVWTRVAYTFAIPPGATEGGIQVQLITSPTGLPAGQHFNVACVDLRATPGWPVGLCANPPPPEQVPIQIEFLRAYRFFFRANRYILGLTTSNPSWPSQPTLQFLTVMRAAPTMTGASFSTGGGGVGNAGTPMAWLSAQQATISNAANNWTQGEFSTTVELTADFSAEL
jgi:hypothetical protein